jgi:AcrR family transcriptional regulator
MGSPTEPSLRREPQQARSRERLEQILAAADGVLASEGAGALTTTRVAEAAGISVGSLYQYFVGKEGIAEALALRYWAEFEERVARVAAADEEDPFADPAGALLDALVAGFRAQPGFMALWYGGLRSERIRDATRPTRTAIAASIERVLAVHWPESRQGDRAIVAAMVALVGDGLLREAFRLDPKGNPDLLNEGRRVLDAYIRDRLGDPR